MHTFNDGELRVRAKAAAPNSPAFSRPVSTGRRRDQSPQDYPRSSKIGGGPQPRPLSAPRGGAGGRLPVSQTSKRVLDALQSLSPAEVERLEAAIRQERASLQSRS